MIAALPEAAAARALLRIRVRRAGLPAEMESMALPLFPVSSLPTRGDGKPWPEDGWVFVRRDAVLSWPWRPVLLEPSEILTAETTTMDADPVRLDHEIVPTVDARGFAEAIAVAWRFHLPIEFVYTPSSDGRAGVASSLRRGVPVGVRADLLFIEDADRDGALRSFKLGAFSSVRVRADSLPRWDSAAHGYAIPGGGA